MPTFAEFIQSPEAFALETVVSENPQYLNKFIEYLTVPQNPMLCNERQCYLYPSKIAEILSLGMSYRLLIQKKQISEGNHSYPFLQKLFSGIRSERTEPTLLGYCSKILISLVRKTPEIYEFIKDHQQLIIEILKDDSKLDCLREFLALLLVESTMELYVFLKSMLVRNLIYQIVEDQNAGLSVYKSITYFYKQLVKALEEAAEDERPELMQVCKLFQDEHFITLFILKLDSAHPLINYYISEFLCLVCPRSEEAAEVISLHIDTILDYLQEYEESQIFMQQIRKDHIFILTLLVQQVKMVKVTRQIIGQLIKRLLVYSNVHSNNSFVHNLLFATISSCREQGLSEVLNQFNIVEFFIKNQTNQRLGFMALRKRVFCFWAEHDLDGQLSEEEKAIVREEFKSQHQKINKSKYYKNFKLNSMSQNLSMTKIPPEMAMFPTAFQASEPDPTTPIVESSKMQSTSQS